MFTYTIYFVYDMILTYLNLRVHNRRTHTHNDLTCLEIWELEVGKGDDEQLSVSVIILYRMYPHTHIYTVYYSRAHITSFSSPDDSHVVMMTMSTSNNNIHPPILWHL